MTVVLTHLFKLLSFSINIFINNTVYIDDLVFMHLTKLEVFVDVHNVEVKSNDVDKSEGVKFC